MHFEFMTFKRILSLCSSIISTPYYFLKAYFYLIALSLFNTKLYFDMETTQEFLGGGGFLSRFALVLFEAKEETGTLVSQGLRASR